MDTSCMGVLTDEQLCSVAEILVLCISYVNMNSLAVVLQLPCTAVTNKTNNTYQQILWLLKCWRTDSDTGQGLPRLIQLLSQWRELPSYIVTQLQSLVGNSPVHHTAIKGDSHALSTKSPYKARCLDDDLEPRETRRTFSGVYNKAQYSAHVNPGSYNGGTLFAPNYKNGFHLWGDENESDLPHHKHNQSSSSSRSHPSHNTSMPQTQPTPGPTPHSLHSISHPSLPMSSQLHSPLPPVQSMPAAVPVAGYQTPSSQDVHSRYASRGLYSVGVPSRYQDTRQYSSLNPNEYRMVSLPPSLQSQPVYTSSSESSTSMNRPSVHRNGVPSTYNRMEHAHRYTHQPSYHSGIPSSNHSYHHTGNSYSAYNTAIQANNSMIPHQTYIPHSTLSATSSLTSSGSTGAPTQQPSSLLMSHSPASSSSSYSVPYIPDNKPCQYEGAHSQLHVTLHEPPLITSTACAEPLTPMSESKADSPPRSLDSHSPKRTMTADPQSSFSSEQHAHEIRHHELQPTKEPPYIDIFCHPMDCQVTLNGIAQLVCQARVLGSSDKPSYLWYKDEEPLIGEVTSEYVIKEVSEEDLGYYFCVVSDVDGIVHRKSRTAFLSLVSEAPANTDRCPPFILHEPDKFIQVSSGDRLVLRIHCRACPPPSYVWYRNTIKLSYATEAELVIPKVSAHTAGQYTCAITNDLGSFLAGPYTLQLIRKPSFPELAEMSSPPLSPAPVGGACISSALASTSTTAPATPATILSSESTAQTSSSSSSYSYNQRLHSGETAQFVLSPFISDDVLSEVSHQLCTHTNNVHQLALAFGIQPMDIAKIRVVYSTVEEQVTQMLGLWATNTCANIDMLQEHLVSKGYNIRVTQSSSSSNPNLCGSGNSEVMVITSHPRSQSAFCGETVRLMIEVNQRLDTRNIAYQWYKDGQPLVKECNQLLVIYLARESDSGLYHCSVIQPHGTIDSRRARINIFAENQQLQEFATTTSHSQRGYCSKDEQLHYSPSFDLYHEHNSGRRESCDTPSLPSLDSMQLGVHKTYSETGVASASAARGHLGLVHMENMAADFQSISLSEAAEKPTILEHPQSQDIEAGGPLQLLVKATGPGELSYLWNFNGLSLPNERRPEFSLHCFTDEDEGNYYCEVSNKYGVVRTNLAVVKLADDPDS